MNKLLVTTAIVCAAGLTSFGASAQSLNYGMMQEMFGEPVTTSANGSPMRASDVPLDMTIITAEEIARYPAREIPDILRYQAGMVVRQNNTVNYSVSTRGYAQPGAERLLVLVNGRPVYEDFYGLVNWSSIPVELGEIRQIEIVRGPNTALFGFNAVSGVVNIVTFNPLYDDVDYVEVDAGLNGYVKGVGVHTFQGDEWAARVSYSNSSIDEDDNNYNPSEAGILTNGSDVQTFNADVAMQLDSSTQARFEVSNAHSYGNTLSAYGDASPLDNTFSAGKFSLSSDTSIGILDTMLFANSLDSEYRQSTIFRFVNDVVAAQVSDTFKVGTDHTFRLAGEFRENQTDHYLNGAYFSTTKLNIKSLSTLWYWNMTEDMSLSVAGRYDHVRGDIDGVGTGFPAAVFAANPYGQDAYNNRYDEFGYNIGYVYKPTDVDTIKATISKGVDLPSPFEIGFQAPGLAYGNPYADVSDVHDFQLIYERDLMDWNATFKASAFYQRINEIQSFRATGATFVIDNLGDSEVHGIELSLDGVTESNIRWGLNYNYSEVQNELPTTQTVDYQGLNSDHIVNANIGYSPNDEWSYDLYGSYFSDFEWSRDYNGLTLPGYEVDADIVLDAKVVYKPVDIKGLSVSLNGQTLLGESEQLTIGEDNNTQVFLRLKYEM